MGAKCENCGAEGHVPGSFDPDVDVYYCSAECYRDAVGPVAQ